MKWHFLGGADTVTGSKHLLEIDGARILFDCGLFQGRRKDAEEINRTLGFDPAAVDAMVLSHAHIDHCGNIPTLAKSGYRNPVHATAATADLLPIMLRDSAHIQEADAAYLNQLKAVFLVTSVFGLTGLWIAILADTGATVLVTLNALRLLRFNPEREA